MRTSLLRRPAVLLALGLLLGSCFEPPVVERLQLRFLPGGAAVVTSVVEVADRDDERNPALARRLAETRQALLEGWDAWSRRFAALEPDAERFSWEKRLGVLRQAKRSAMVAEPRSLERFFGDTGLQVSYGVRDGVAELAIAPGVPQRASREQRRKVEARLASWSAEVAAYLARGAALYEYLDEHPERAQACFAVLFEDVLPEGQGLKAADLPGDEARRVEALEEAMGAVLAVLTVEEGADYSLDELSHLVYDPFPARLTVELPGAPLELEGFAPGPEGGLAVPGLSLWEALRALEGRWLAPDPALLYAAQAASGKPLDLDALLARGRSAGPAPDADEVRLALEGDLAPAPLYRVVWRSEPAQEGDGARLEWPD